MGVLPSEKFAGVSVRGRGGDEAGEGAGHTKQGRCDIAEAPGRGRGRGGGVGQAGARGPESEDLALPLLA